jgi:molybdate transport system substrate-binding protein
MPSHGTARRLAETSAGHRRRSRLRGAGLARIIACTAAAGLLAACGSSGPTSSSTPSTPASGGATSANANGQVTGTVIVFAAASLNGAFDKLGKQFEQQHPGVTMKFNYAGSSSLATSIGQGAKADLFASANTANMDTVTKDNLASGSPAVFAKNKLEIMVNKGNPMNIKSVSNLANPVVKVAVCAPAVPCGAYSKDVFDKANVTVKPVSQESSVSGVVTKVSLGEADAGIVYVTDVKAAGNKVSGVRIPASQNVIADYPIVKLKDAPNSSAASAFMNYVRSTAGQKVLDDYGFIPAGS